MDAPLAARDGALTAGVTALQLAGLRKQYGDNVVVAGFDLDVRAGELVALLGPTGCGKTTVLRMIAGLVAPSGGAVRIEGADVTALPPHRRRLGLVFQSYALFPHLTVAGNVAFGLRRQGVRGAELAQRVARALDLVRLAALADRLPRQLSGGQQQRVALARAIAPAPRLLLLDEPLSNLDAQLREEMQIEIRRLQRELNITSIFVTHDQHEALSLSDRICLMDRGRVQQVGTPQDVYFAPANAFVAGFLGRATRLRCRVLHADAGRLHLRLAGGAEIAATGSAAPGSEVEVLVRHEAVRLGAPAAAGLPATVLLRAFAGAHAQLVLRLDGGEELVAEADAAAPDAGARVTVAIDPRFAFVAAP